MNTDTQKLHIQLHNALVLPQSNTTYPKLSHPIYFSSLVNPTIFENINVLKYITKALTGYIISNNFDKSNFFFIIENIPSTSTLNQVKSSFNIENSQFDSIIKTFLNNIVIYMLKIFFKKLCDIEWYMEKIRMDMGDYIVYNDNDSIKNNLLSIIMNNPDKNNNLIISLIKRMEIDTEEIIDYINWFLYPKEYNNKFPNNDKDPIMRTRNVDDCLNNYHNCIFCSYTNVYVFFRLFLSFDGPLRQALFYLLVENTHILPVNYDGKREIENSLIGRLLIIVPMIIVETNALQGDIKGFYNLQLTFMYAHLLIFFKWLLDEQKSIFYCIYTHIIISIDRRETEYDQLIKMVKCQTARRDLNEVNEISFNPSLKIPDEFGNQTIPHNNMNLIQFDSDCLFDKLATFKFRMFIFSLISYQKALSIIYLLAWIKNIQIIF